jgi:hypothetical protein
MFFNNPNLNIKILAKILNLLIEKNSIIEEKNLEIK